MSESGSSYRDLLRSTVMIGGSTATRVLIGVVKLKVLAIVVGPAGVGLMGVYTNLVTTASVVAGLGVGSSGVRQIAAAGGTEHAGTVRQTLMAFSVVSGGVAGVLIALFREPLSVYLTDTPDHAGAIGWLGLAVFLALFSTSQGAVLQGQRRIRELATVSIVGALGSAIAGILSVLSWGEDGILLFTLTTPAAAAAAGFLYNQRGSEVSAPFSTSVAVEQAREMIRVGVPFMGAALVNTGAQLATRALIVHWIDLDASGHFQAAWTIASTYVGFVLGAMSADYYPRLVSTIEDHDRAVVLVDEQMEVALLVGAPVLLAMMAFAPWVLTLLYSAHFEPAADMLRLQILGDALRLMTWPMGFVLIAKGRGTLYLGAQLLWNVAYLACLAATLTTFGVASAGAAFTLASGVTLVLYQVLTRRMIGYRPRRKNLAIGGALMLACTTVLAASTVAPLGAMGLGAVLTALTVAGSYRQIRASLRRS
ncbi:MAG: O-antigen translocase [Alphaproteobacteria bacterium]|nr:O-antigen translocase [Alphaproteobacteria bacterium]MCB9697326.1 O-antigen translocase [Alphaproteobacteria bacterium]